VLIFSTNPGYRWQNLGEFNMLANAILHFNDFHQAVTPGRCDACRQPVRLRSLTSRLMWSRARQQAESLSCPNADAGFVFDIRSDLGLRDPAFFSPAKNRPGRRDAAGLAACPSRSTRSVLRSNFAHRFCIIGERESFVRRSARLYTNSM